MAARVQNIDRNRRWLALALSAIAAAALALLWSRLISPQAVIGYQADLLEGIGAAGVWVALGLSFTIGVSMIFVPCTFPLVFALSPLAEEARTRRGWIAAITLFSLGLTAAMAAVGAIIALAGSALLGLFAEEQARLNLTLLLYSMIGLFALAYALHEFGFFALPGLPMAEMPGWARTLGRYPRSLILGLVVGGGLGVGCPAPTYYALLLFDAAVGDALFGAALLAVNALGRVAPIVLIGSIFFAGTAPGTVSHWVAQRRAAVRIVNGVALTLLGGFLLTYWTVGVGLGLL